MANEAGFGVVGSAPTCPKAHDEKNTRVATRFHA
jgi:hypothetical protein